MSAVSESFIFGFANSLHCAGMCGPLACCFHGGTAGTACYHLGRTTSYVIAGVAAGSIGAVAGSGSITNHAAWVSMGMAAFLLLMVFGLHHHLQAVPGLGKLFGSTFAWTNRLSPLSRATSLGLLTGLLPCGLLYAAYASALIAGSWEGGAQVMFGFAMGSLPILALAQIKMNWLRSVLSPRARLNCYRGLMLLAAGILFWRGWLSLQQTTCCQ